MRRGLAGALAGLLLAVLVLPGAAAAATRASFTQIEDEVMCVVCHEPLAVAQSPEAFQERDYIRGLILQGKSRREIENDLVQQYGPAVLAKPPVRKLARDAGVDLRSLVGSGPGGTITRADVTAAIGATATVGTVTASPTDALAYAPSPAPTVEMLPQVDPATREQRIPIKGVRKVMAQAMVGSAFSAPHVTIWATADMTPTMEFLGHLKGRPEFAGVRVSPLLMAARALLVALRRHPMVNSSWDDDAQEIVVKDYVNLGIAAATPRGLVVPNIKDAGRLALPGLATALNALADTARAGRTSTEDMSRGTITITNVGFLGMDTGTPILNPGESAILCFGVVRPTPWVHQGSITVRQITQLALSFDHRHIDGQLGAGFLADIATLLADPAQFAVWG